MYMIYFIYTYIIYNVYIIYIYWFIVELLIKMVILHVFLGKGVHNLATSGFIMIYLKIGFPE